MPELTDADLPAYWDSLGLPGVIDAHVHFLPERMQAKVWAYFDRANDAPLLGVDWPIHYRVGEPERLATLRSLGVLAFSGLLYPHKPGMAAWLNGWAAEFARRTPDCIQSATFFAEPDAPDYVQAALDGGARVFKVHVQVGGFDPADPLLDPVWGLLADSGVPVVTHCGSGPAPGAFTGPGPIHAVLARHPQLTLVVAHMGMPEYAEFLALAAAYPNVHLDTTMVGTDFLEGLMPLPPAVPASMADLGDRILLGSDFPTIPYPYAHQIESLVRLGLGDDWLRGVLYRNGARLFGVPARTLD